MSNTGQKIRSSLPVGGEKKSVYHESPTPCLPSLGALCDPKERSIGQIFPKVELPLRKIFGAPIESCVYYYVRHEKISKTACPRCRFITLKLATDTVTCGQITICVTPLDRFRKD